MLVGLLKVPVDSCSEVAEKFGKEVFEVGWLHNIDHPAADRPRHASEALECCIKGTIQRSGHDPSLLLSSVAAGSTDPAHSPPTPRVLVVARRGQGPYLSRSYHDTVDAGTAGTDA